MHVMNDVRNVIVEHGKFTNCGRNFFVGFSNGRPDGSFQNLARTYCIFSQPANGSTVAGQSSVLDGMSDQVGGAPSFFRNVISYRNWAVGFGTQTYMNHGMYHLNCIEAQTEGYMIVGAGGAAIDHKYGSHIYNGFKGNFAAHCNIGFVFGSATEAASGPKLSFSPQDSWVTQPKYRVELSGGEPISSGPLGLRYAADQVAAGIVIKWTRCGSSDITPGTTDDGRVVVKENGACTLEFEDCAFMGDTRLSPIQPWFSSVNSSPEMRVNHRRTVHESLASNAIWFMDIRRTLPPMATFRGSWTGNSYRFPNIGLGAEIVRQIGFNQPGTVTNNLDRSALQTKVGESIPSTPTSPTYSSYADFDKFVMLKGFATTDAYITRVRTSWLGGTGSNELRLEYAGDEAVRITQLGYNLPSGLYASGTGGYDTRRNSGRPGVIRI
jgi:hypothetical protein